MELPYADVGGFVIFLVFYADFSCFMTVRLLQNWFLYNSVESAWVIVRWTIS